MKYPARILQALRGREAFHTPAGAAPFRVEDFWRWALSDLTDNVVRGRLAEFIVANALGIAGEVRQGWDAVDLRVPDGPTIQVKSCAYLQSWGQRQLSQIVFDIRPRLGWDPLTNTYGTERKRQSDLYVFALLHHRDKATLDPLNLTQWTFYVVPTKVLDGLLPIPRTITLPKLLALSAVKADFDSLRAYVQAMQVV